MKALKEKFFHNKFARLSLPVLAVLLIIFLTVIFTKEAKQYAPPPELGMYISFGEGEILISKNNTEWEPAAYGTVLFNGDRIRSGNNSKVVLQSPWGSTVRLSENAEIAVSFFSEKDVLLIQNYGRTYHKIKMHNDSSTFSYKIRALNNTIETKGGIFDLSTNINDNKTNVKILDGKIDIAVNLADVIEVQKIGKGKEITIDPGNINLITLADIANEYLATQWYSWNKQEDEKYFYEASGSEETTDATAQANTDTNTSKRSNGAIAATEPSTPEISSGSCRPYLSAKKEKTYNGILVYWTTCKSDDFQYYKIVRSTLNSNPSYPNDPVVSSSSNRSYANFIDKTVAPTRTYYYRVCVLERQNKVSCSNTVSVTY